MKICVVGLGYVGAVTSCCLAQDGHQVIGVDLDQTKIDLLASGRSPIIEAQIPEITKTAVESGNLTVTNSMNGVIATCDLIFVCVGTPSAANGSQDLTAVARVCEQIGSNLSAAEGEPVVVIRSTVPAGTTDTLVKEALEKTSGKISGKDFGLGFQPEFLREGSSVDDFYNPPMTIVGGDELTADRLRSVFGKFPGDFLITDVRSAELLKVACNTFHAVKINFANEIGRIAKSLGMDARNVMELLCQDTQLNISRAYLRPGFAFGGSCLPKDLRALLHTAKSRDVDVPMLQGILPSNDEHIQSVINTVTTHGNRSIGLVGLSFKQGTDDLRESPLVRLAEILIGKGYDLSVYDSAVQTAMLMGSNRRFIDDTIPHFEILMRDEIEDTIKPGRTIIVAHNYDGVPALLQTLTADDLVVDLVGIDAEITAHVEGIAW